LISQPFPEDIMQPLRRIRRVVAAGLLTLYLPSCSSWKLGYLSPAEMLTEVVHVTTTDGKETALVNPWVRGDSLIASRRNAWGTADRDTIAIALAAVRTIQVGGYKGTPEADRTIPVVLARTHPGRVRVTTAAGAFQLVRPWVANDSLLGSRPGTKPGTGDTIRVALPAIRRLEMRAYDGSETMVLIGVSLVVVTAAVVAANCGYGCNKSFGW
jgi:hypothetical protein